jgi:hypothetical protein
VVGKAQKSHGARSGLSGGCSNGVPPIHFFSKPNTEFNSESNFHFKFFSAFGPVKLLLFGDRKGPPDRNS